MRELRPVIADVQESWAIGVQPLVDAYGSAITPLLHAIVFSHRANFPVPVFVTGSGRSRASELLQAVSELTGDWPILQRRTTTLPALRLAAERRVPLLVDGAAPATAGSPSMFELISDEMLDYGSPLQEVSLLVATGARRISRELRDRTVAIALPTPGPAGVVLRRLTSPAAVDARRVVQIYLQQNAGRALTPKARRQVAAAADDTMSPAVRAAAALDAALVLERAMELPAITPSEDPVLTATRAALTQSLTDPTIAGRLDRGTLYAVPAALLEQIRTHAGDEGITRHEVVRSLEEARMLISTTGASGQGSATPTRTPNGLQRVWRIRSSILRPRATA